MRKNFFCFKWSLERHMRVFCSLAPTFPWWELPHTAVHWSLVLKYFNQFYTLLNYIHFWKKTQNMFFSKINKKKISGKKKHLNLWRIAQLLMRGFLSRIFRYCLKIKNQNEKKKTRKIKKKNLKNLTTHKASNVTPIWRPLGQGSSLAT